MKNKVLFTLIIIVAVIFLIFLQIYLIGGKTLFGIKPNLILISVIVLTSFLGLYYGVIYSFFVGIVLDFLYGSNYGIFLTSYVLVAIVIGLIEKNYRKQNKNTLVIITFIGNFIFELVLCIIYSIFCERIMNVFSLIMQILFSSVINMTIVFILNEIVKKIAEFFKLKSRKRDIL